MQVTAARSSLGSPHLPYPPSDRGWRAVGSLVALPVDGSPNETSTYGIGCKPKGASKLHFSVLDGAESMTKKENASLACRGKWLL